MDTKNLIFGTVVLAVLISVLLFPLGVVAVVVGLLTAALIVAPLRSVPDVDDAEKDFLMRSFLIGLILRVLLAATIFGFGLELIFAPDATGYDLNSWLTAERWRENTLLIHNSGGGSVFDEINNGLTYFIAAIYYVIGRNALAIQFISSICGAACAPLTYLNAKMIFRNQRVARVAALFVAAFPAMIIWSAQVLKDGFIVFLLVLGIYLILLLQKRFSYLNVACLLLVMLGIFTLRFYLFPLLVVAAVASFLISSDMSFETIVRRTVGVFVIGIALSFLGVLQRSQSQIENTNLQEIARVRRGGSLAAQSGIDDESDVSTTGGAIAALPMGLATLLAAPFPWQMTKITQLLLLPEMVLWWSSLPLTFAGMWYCVKKRFPENVSILIFIVILSLFYALSQGNVGTLYRQRTQIQVFLLMFTAVGYVLRLEKKENAKLARRLP